MCNFIIPSEREMRRNEEMPVYSWEKHHILIVEDDDPTAYLLQEVLKKTGAQLTHVDDGLQAVDFIRNHPETNLILMDVHLPDKDGFTAAREIKGFAPNMVIIAQTSYAFSMEHNDATQAGCDDFFTKPLDMVRLLGVMDRFLTRPTRK